MIKKLTAVSALLFLLISCGKSPADARKELAQLDVPYDEGTCAIYTAEGDEIVTNLFLATNIDPGCVVAGAVEAEDIDLVKKALKQEFDPENEYATSALQQSIDNDRDDIAKLLVGKGIQSERAFSSVVEAGNTDLVKFFLNKGADPNDGILAAAESGEVETAKLLFNKGADINYDPNNKNSHNSIALCEAASSGHQEMVKLLLDKKADPNSQTTRSCLVNALANNHLEVADLLKKAGAKSPSLAGEWEINYTITSTEDMSGNITNTTKYYTKYINLTQNSSVITGQTTGVEDGICDNTAFNGKVTDNKITFTEQFSGDCCPDAEMTYEAKVDYTSSDGKIVGSLQPTKKPSQNCNLWYGTFEASQRS